MSESYVRVRCLTKFVDTDTNSFLEFHWLVIMIWRAVCFLYRIRPMKTNEIERIYIDTYWRLFIFRPKLSILSKSQYVKHSFCCAFHLNKRTENVKPPIESYLRYIWCWALEFGRSQFWFQKNENFEFWKNIQIFLTFKIRPTYLIQTPLW